MKIRISSFYNLLFIAALLGCLVAPAQAVDIESVLNTAYDKYRNLEEGANADYIPALAKVDPELFGIVLVTVDGKVYSVGDVTSEVSIQSISKVFTMAKVMEESGPDAISDNMGVDATGQVFNSIVAIEQYKGQQMNATDRTAMIRSMVEGLDERLTADGADIDGWMRLIRARMVLGEKDKAADALNRAVEALKNDQPAVTQLEETRKALGL